MCWGHVKLCKTDHGDEYLEFNESQTKTRIGADPRVARAFAPKMFSTNRSVKDPVAVYTVFAEKRPEKINDPDAPFYLANVKSKSTVKC